MLAYTLRLLAHEWSPHRDMSQPHMLQQQNHVFSHIQLQVTCSSDGQLGHKQQRQSHIGISLNVSLRHDPSCTRSLKQPTLKAIRCSFQVPNLLLWPLKTLTKLKIQGKGLNSCLADSLILQILVIMHKIQIYGRS